MSVERQRGLVTQLRQRAFSQPDPAANLDLIAELVDAESNLAEQEKEQRDGAQIEKGVRPSWEALGKETTGIEVRANIKMKPVPTGIYHILNQETDPLIIVDVKNSSENPRRVCVTTFVEGVTAKSVRTVELEPFIGEASVTMLPTILPQPARRITEVQKATLHLVVDDLDGKLELHDTYIVTMMSRNSSFNVVRDPETGESKSLSQYYGAWVTPFAEVVQTTLRRCAESHKDKMLGGDRKSAQSVREQVEAVYKGIKNEGLTYINSVIDFGATETMATQRTRLPRESLRDKAANCIDGTVLMASMLEGITLSPAIVLVPGHALLGWESSDNSGTWRYLETTMLGSASFEQACESAERLIETYSEIEGTKVLSLKDLRAQGIWPME